MYFEYEVEMSTQICAYRSRFNDKTVNEVNKMFDVSGALNKVTNVRKMHSGVEKAIYQTMRFQDTRTIVIRVCT